MLPSTESPPAIVSPASDPVGYTTRTDAFGRHVVMPPPTVGSEPVRTFPATHDGYLRAVEWREGLSAAYLAGVRIRCG